MLKKIAILLLPFMFCLSESIEIGLNDVTTIQDTSGLERILFKIDLEGIPETSVIDFAELFVPGFLPPNVEIVFGIEARRIARDWDANNVSWDHPWVNPGGDFDTTYCCLFTLDNKDVTKTHLDVTPIIKSMIEGEANYGVILKRPEFEGNGFTQYGSELYEKLVQAKIVILYHFDK